MPVFAVVAINNPNVMRDALQKQYGANLFQFGSNVWFVQDTVSTKDISDKIGITDGRVGASGVVLRFDGYSGYGPTTAWQWLSNHPGAISNG